MSRLRLCGLKLRLAMSALVPFLALLMVSVVTGDTPTRISKPGGAGHALLFRDQIVVKTDLRDFPTTHFTFEAWISSTDFCHAGTILSYAKNSQSTDENQRIADFNHFVIFDPRNLLACHDFKYIDLKPDSKQISCHAHFRNVSKSDKTANYVERDGSWHHLAVTWSVEDEGLTKIYLDGMLMASSYSFQTKPLEPGGALMLGGEQDCFAGCTDPSQGFYGMLDEVRIWKVVRSQDEIMRSMRSHSGLEGHKDLSVYWKFNDPDEDNGQFRRHEVAKDSSGKGNDLVLINPPRDAGVEIKQGNKALKTGMLTFRNNLAINKGVQFMPEKSFTIEFWAKGQNASKEVSEASSRIFSYATERRDGVAGQPLFMDNAILIERYLKDYSGRVDADLPLRGVVSLHVNSNEMTKDNDRAETWIDFDAGWVDDEWHHVAVTWEQDTGNAKLFFDGKAKNPIIKSDRGRLEQSKSGVNPSIGRGSIRSAQGSLVIGQDQNCFGGCFSPASAYSGDLAVLRVWNRALTEAEVGRNMFRDRPEKEDGLISLYIFTSEGLKENEQKVMFAYDLAKAKSNHHLELRSNPPSFQYSTAPLTYTKGKPVPKPTPGAAGYALALSDKQVLMMPNFADFPSEAITVEFWMMSVDTCRPGVPFSYAHGHYEKGDNAFLIFDYNSWGIAVMEDEGTLADHKSGVSSTDGNWHHIAVTWDSASGLAKLYDNSRLVWTVKRAQGKRITAGGTLVIGREQDCEGGCFDSATGAAGKVSEVTDQEYGPQDFFGLIEEMRVWKVVRTQEQIRQGMALDDGRGDNFDKPGIPHDHPDLVAYWRFDEGQGFLVNDVTGHGHDLILTQPPRWEVVRYLSTCGNGNVEGIEECDDGDASDGDGCSATCKIEPGWECQGNPSHCYKKGGDDHKPTPPPAPVPPPAPTPGPTPPSGSPPASADTHSHSDGGGRTGGAKKSHSAGSAVLGVFVTFLVLGIIGGVAYTYRYTIYEHFPQVEAGVQQLSRFMPGQKPSYHTLAVDPEELDLSPEFLSPSPHPRASAPGHPGPYEPIYDGTRNA